MAVGRGLEEKYGKRIEEGEGKREHMDNEYYIVEDVRTINVSNTK